MGKIGLILILCLLLSCKNKTKISNLPIEIYKMSNLEYDNKDYYVIYNHEGKDDSTLVYSVVDFNRRTMSLDSILKRDFYYRRFYKQDKILTKDYREDHGVIRDYADRCVIHIEWWKYIENNSDTLIVVGYNIRNDRFPSKTYHWSSSISSDSSLLNPIPWE